ncbi:MAG: hypothetical protein B6D73_15305 [gamma proteobacterium symbiont of Stewartia floridana]|nr:MAG: hypothetical protein B6D73_15305 [gamma proteobacterium symbiont of Stewartia floridana]
MSRLVYFLILLIFFSPLVAEDFCDKAYWDIALVKEEEKCLNNAELGNDEAQFGYGLIQLGGHDRISKPNEAFEWFTKSAKQGNHLAQTIFGRMLSDSRFGVSLDLPNAYAWWAVSNNKNSANKLWLRLTSDQQDKAKELEKKYASAYVRE